jgi:PhnB protein
MPQNPPEGYPRISPYLLYEDAGAAVDWLKNAFGFTERMRMPDDSGRVSHAELELGDGVVMLGTPGREAYKNPKNLGGNTSFVYIYVDDVDAHFAHAKEAGAEIESEPEDQVYGDRHYSAKDPEGHAWFFAQHIRDVSPEEMGATTAEAAATS